GAAGVSAEPSTSPERTVVSAVLGAALLVLMSAIVLVVWHVLRPADGYVVDLDEISRYPTFEYVSRRKVRVQGELLRDHVDAVDRDRRRNDQKTEWLGRAYALVCLGLALVTATGVVVTIGHPAT